MFQASLLDNLKYGNGPDSTGRNDMAIQGTDLLGVSALPDGLQTALAGGALVSGGEGGCRIGRALARPDGLAILEQTRAVWIAKRGGV